MIKCNSQIRNVRFPEKGFLSRGKSEKNPFFKLWYPCEPSQVHKMDELSSERVTFTVLEASRCWKIHLGKNFMHSLFCEAKSGGVYNAKRGFTLVELLVVISILSILSSLLLTSLKGARDAVKSSSCVNNLKQMGLAIHQYANDNNDLLPPVNASTGFGGWNSQDIWYNLLSVYLGNNTKVFVCLSASTSDMPSASAVPAPSSGHKLANVSFVPCYAENNNMTGDASNASLPLRNMSQIPNSSKSFLICDANYPYISSGLGAAIPSGVVALRHSKKANVLLVDGHVAQSTDPLETYWLFVP